MRNDVFKWIVIYRCDVPRGDAQHAVVGEALNGRHRRVCTRVMSDLVRHNRHIILESIFEEVIRREARRRQNNAVLHHAREPASSGHWLKKRARSR